MENKQVQKSTDTSSTSTRSNADGATSVSSSLRGMGYAVQREALSPSSSPGDGAVAKAAARGVSGAGGKLPHLSAIQGSFGRHDVSKVNAHVGGAATSASKDMGAKGYATGNQVAFQGTPDLHTAAHEAAHVVQQRAGVSLKDGVGRAGDTYEQHADSVADAVVQGKSAEGILDRMAGAGGGGAGAGVQLDGESQADALRPSTPAVQLEEAESAATDPAAADPWYYQAIDWAIDAMGYGTGDTEDYEALASQTASNLVSAHGQLGTLGDLMDAAGVPGGSKCRSVVANFRGVADLAAGVKTVLSAKKKIELCERVIKTSAAVYEVDMSDSDAAAAAFDAWFAAVGELGSEAVGLTPWGPILSPYFEFMSQLGVSGFFANVKRGFEMHGTRNGTNTDLLRELEEEGY